MQKQDMKKFLSSSPSQIEFPIGQVTLKAHFPKWQWARVQACHLFTKS